MNIFTFTLVLVTFVLPLLALLRLLFYVCIVVHVEL